MPSLAPAPAPSFTAHRIRLDDGSHTMPEGEGWLIAEDPWCAGAKRVLRTAFAGDPQGRSIVDLGCLEGGFTVEFARMGLRSLGLEVRRTNFEACLHAQRRLSLPNLAFARDDVWNLARHGPFDAAFCCGLLYHLDRPAAFLRLLGECVRRVVIVNTHVAPVGTPPDGFPFALSDLTENEGLPGRWFAEHEADDETALERLRWASWSNRRSFWLTRDALAQAIRAAGFDLVLEQFDCHAADADPDLLASLRGGWSAVHSRAVLVGLRTGEA
jgi:SAM-dependent methyltransferase